MYRRPKANETEEDLLRLQNEFFENKANKKCESAAKVISVKEDSKNVKEESKSDVQFHIDNTFEAIPSNIMIGEIKENRRDVLKRPVSKLSQPERGFPQAKRREAKAGSSLFSQRTKRVKQSEVNLPSESCMITNEEKDKIHEENMKLLSTMSMDEILKEKEHLLSTMDPAIVAFVRSRRENFNVAAKHKTPSAEEQNSVAKNFKLEDIETVGELLNKEEAERWLNFDIIETNKLSWMKKIEIPKIGKNEQYEARFDFDGWLLPFSLPEIDEKTRILYHHGEEPARPGYTLQELFQLSRSSVIQQKIVALNTLSNIIKLHSTGIYDNVIELPIEQCFFVIRFCLDDNTPTVLNAAIKAMRNLFYSTVDESCLDSLMGFGIGLTQPILSVEDTNEDDPTVNDQQLVETNIVKCLTRTNILTRIKYIINTIKPPPETIIYCLEILCRLARDSNFIMIKVYNCENLIRSIIKYFVPSNFSEGPDLDYKKPLLQAIKFLRLLSSRSRRISEDFINKHNIMDSLLFYLSDETFGKNSSGVRLQIECLNLWRVFLHYGLTLEHFRTFTPLLLSMLNFHVNQTDITSTFTRQSHGAALLNLIAKYAEKGNLHQDYYRLLSILLEKLISQLNLSSSLTCGKLQLISSCFMCFSVFNNCDQFDGIIAAFLNSSGFSCLTNTVESSSNYLNNFRLHRASANFKTVEAAAWDASEHIIPVLQTNSCVPFLRAFSEFVLKCTSNMMKIKFVQHENVKKYISSLIKQRRFYLTTNWFSRSESELLMNILKISVDIQDYIDTSEFYELSVKCLNVFNIEQVDDVKYVFKEIIFNKKYYSSEVLFKNLSISDNLISFDNMTDIYQVYIKVLNLNTVNFNISIDIKIGNLVPVDWIYTPIMVLYSNHQQKKQMLEQEQVYLVENCLRWILIYAVHFTKLATLINPSDHYCRLACIFLVSDSLFLNKNIQILTELCFKNLITYYGKEIDFNKPIHGLDNFQNFYTQLLEQYQGVSYGDVLFGNFILVPLAQRHDLKWRKTLWSEYAGVIEIFNVTQDLCLCPMEMFLSPPETDISLLKCYNRLLISGKLKQDTVLYNIAKYHIDTFKMNQSKVPQ